MILQEGKEMSNGIRCLMGAILGGITPHPSPSG